LRRVAPVAPVAAASTLPRPAPGSRLCRVALVAPVAAVARVACAGEIDLLHGRCGLVRPGLLLFADYVCPFCFLAASALGPLRDRGVRVEGVALREDELIAWLTG
jgi:hypothetical protein